MVSVSFEDARAALSQVPWTTVIGAVFGFMVAFYTLRAIYLVTLHPYAKYPGPKLAAVTDWWYAYHWLTGRYPWVVEKILQEYGDVVRVAPNELVFFTAQAMDDILMTGMKGKPLFPKTNFYTVRGKYAGIAAEQDPEKHKAIRKMLSPALQPRAIKEMDPVLHNIFDGLVNKLTLQGGVPQGINITQWFDWTACDLSGSLAYGHNFRNIEKEGASIFLETFNQLSHFGTWDQILKRFPLLRPFLLLTLPASAVMKLPWFLSEQNKIVKARVDSRNERSQRDYFTAFISDDKPIPEREFLVAQANHFIIGGLDPDTNLFTSAVYFLARQPEFLKKIQDEVRGTFKTYEDIEDDGLKPMTWLGAAIEESMRLHTPGAFGLPRISPGATVDGHYIPKGCVVQTSGFAATHSERYWEKPRDFCPQRWLPETHPEYDPAFKRDVHESFKPFSMGPRGCMGKEMGYRQVRLLLGKLAWKLDWDLINGDSIKWEEDLRLFATWSRPPIYIKFTPSACAVASGEKAANGVHTNGVAQEKLIPV